MGDHIKTVNGRPRRTKPHAGARSSTTSKAPDSTVQNRASYFSKKTSGLRTKIPRGREQKTKGKKGEIITVGSSFKTHPHNVAKQYSKVEERLSRTTGTYRIAMVVKFSGTEC
jgi:hypothetical protein